MSDYGLSPSKAYDGLGELSKIIISAIGIGYMLFFFKDLIMPCLVALFLFYLVRGPAAIIRAQVNNFMRFLKCCNYCVPPKKRGSDSDDESDEDVDHGEQYTYLTDESKTKRAKKGKVCCDCGHVTAFCIMMVMLMFCVFAMGLVMFNSVQTLQIGNPSKLQIYSKQLLILEKQTINYVEKMSNLKGNPALEKFKTLDVLTSVAGQVLKFIPEFATSLMTVMIILAFFLACMKVKVTKPTAGGFEAQIISYISVKTKISALAGLFVFLIFLCLNVPLAATWGLLTFVLNFIPNFGAMIAALLPAPILLLDPSLSTAQTVLGFLLPCVVHLVVGNLVEPWCFYHNEDLQLHPLTSLLCVVVWIMIWGIPGGVLAVPLTTMMRLYFVEHKQEHRILGYLSDGLNAFQKPKEV